MVLAMIKTLVDQGVPRDAVIRAAGVIDDTMFQGRMGFADVACETTAEVINRGDKPKPEED